MTDLQKTDAPGALAIPEDFKTHAGMGTQGITEKDVRPPRLMLAQSMSPQVKRSDPKYIDGLQEGHIFNDLTGEIYNPTQKESLKITIVKFLGLRYVEFDEAGKVKDGNVPANDPRTMPTEDEEGKWVKPVASRFYDYLVFLPESMEVMTFSVKNKQAETVGKVINSLITLPAKVNGQLVMNAPACARMFKLGTAPEKNDKGSWVVFTVKQDGWTPDDVRHAVYAISERFKDANVVIEREPGEDEDVPDLT